MNSFLGPARGLLLAGLVSPLPAETLEIRPTPVLQATLPSSSTWQVESAAGAGAWTPSGVLVAGSGVSITLRLDGFSAAASYRFTRLGTGTLLTPARSTGYHLAGLAAGIPELGVESSSNLAAWSHAGTVFPNAAGQYLKMIPAPLTGRAFYRTRAPEIASGAATVTSYPADPDEGAAGFGPVADEMPAIYQNGFIAATSEMLYNRGGQTASGAGECYEFSGPDGTTTAIIGEYASSPPSGTGVPGRAYFDLGTPAFAALADPAAGTAGTRYRVVPAPVTGNIKLYVVNNTGGFYLNIRPYNHRAGISKLEIKNNGSGTWIELPRSLVNSFEYNGAALVFPLTVRMTSRFGELLTFTPVASMSTGNRVALNAQFANFPATTPVAPLVPAIVYTDGFSTVPGDVWSALPSSGVTLDAAYTVSPYQGTSSLRISNLGAFKQVDFFSPSLFPTPAHGALEFALRAETGTADAAGVVLTGKDSGGASSTSPVIALPSIGGTWRVFRVALGAAGMPARISGFRIVSTSAAIMPVLQMDSMSFLQP